MLAVIRPVPVSEYQHADVLTQRIGQFRAGTHGRLKAITPEQAEKFRTVRVLEGQSLAAIATAFGITLGVQPVPEVVAAWRLRAVAKMAGIADGVDAAIASLPEPQKTIVYGAWNEGVEIHRTSATTLAIGAALNLTSEQIDTFFRQAAAIEV